MNEENEKSKFKKSELSSEIKIHLEKFEIEKNKYDNLITIKKNILKPISKEEKELFEIYKQKINSIFNYIDFNFKKYVKIFEYNGNDFRDEIFEQLDFIEKILIELIQKTNILIKENPNEYKEIIKILISNTFCKKNIFVTSSFLNFFFAISHNDDTKSIIEFWSKFLVFGKIFS